MRHEIKSHTTSPIMKCYISRHRESGHVSAPVISDLSVMMNNLVTSFTLTTYQQGIGHGVTNLSLEIHFCRRIIIFPPLKMKHALSRPIEFEILCVLPKAESLEIHLMSRWESNPSAGFTKQTFSFIHGDDFLVDQTYIYLLTVFWLFV